MSNHAGDTSQYKIVVRFGDEILQAGFTAVPNLLLDHYTEMSITPTRAKRGHTPVAGASRCSTTLLDSIPGPISTALDISISPLYLSPVTIQRTFSLRTEAYIPIIGFSLE